MCTQISKNTNPVDFKSALSATASEFVNTFVYGQ